VSANDNRQRPDLETLEEAADWVDRLDELSSAERQELTAWLEASPMHAAAFASLRRNLRDPALLAAIDRVRDGDESLAAPSIAPIIARTAPRTQRWGLIAAGLIALAAGSTLTARLLWTSRTEAPIELATAIGARSDYALSDASVIHLNADSQATVVYGKAARDVRLHKGDAMFDVAKNANRPFNVMAGDTKVTAVGTTFEVDRVSDAVEVRVFEGAVRVSRANAAPRLVGKGEWLLLASDRKVTAGRFAPETYQGWRSDWLDAEQMPLKYVVARLNRYTADQVVLSEGAIGDLKVTGRFRLDQTHNALAMISALLAVDAAKQGRHIYLSPRRPSPEAAPARRRDKTLS
jgi:transmembrane sensor